MNLSLESIDFNEAWSQIQRVLNDPQSNLTAAVLLLSITLIVILIVVVGAIGLLTSITSGRKRPENPELEALVAYLALLEAEEAAQAGTEGRTVVEGVDTPAPESPPPAPQEPPAKPRDLAWWLTGAALALAVGTAALVAVGVTTAQTTVCLSCHAETPHSAAQKAGVSDPHQDTRCVRCHEPSGAVGSVTIEVPGRLWHFATGWAEGSEPQGYGAIMNSGCLRCHSTITDRITVDEERGIRMAHVHPLDAGADCRDCHTAAKGVVSSTINGMSSCLRCHDGKQQSAECSTCHTKDISAATSSHVNPGQLKGTKLVETPDCGLCHNQPKECDPCHGGTRMPHTKVFMNWGHARKAAEDVWFNNSEGCTTCHTPQRRSCKKCHTFEPQPGHALTWAEQHKATAPSAAASCDSCHSTNAWAAHRDFCAICHGERVDQ